MWLVLATCMNVVCDNHTNSCSKLLFFFNQQVPKPQQHAVTCILDVYMTWQVKMICLKHRYKIWVIVETDHTFRYDNTIFIVLKR